MMNYQFTVATCAWLAAVWIAQAAPLSPPDRASLPNQSIPDYRAGDVVSDDIVSPFEFAVVNAERTERLRQQELEKLPAIYRFDPWVAVQAEERFSQAFSKTRAAFLEAMETAAHRKTLDEATTAHPSFWRFVDWFKDQHPEFPLTTNLAKMWAVGEPDDRLQFDLQSCLRDISSRYIRAGALPARADTPEVQLITTDNPRARLTLADVKARADIAARTQVWSLSEAREEVIRRVGPEGQELAKFSGTFLRENISFDDWLTTQQRQERAAELVVFEQYSPGQLVIRAGQIVDANAKAALDVLSTALKRQQSRTAPPATPPSQDFKFSIFNFQFSIPMMIAVASLVIVVLCWLLFSGRAPRSTGPICEAYSVVMNPARNETIFLPVSTDTAGVASGPLALSIIQPRAEGPLAMQWQGQLREAEQRAEELLALVRAGLAPHLAKELTHRLVQELMCQRTTLLRAHQLAEQEIVALEARFDTVYRELRERLSTYEKRTAELEKELLSKSEQTRELLNATILLTQQKLEQQKTGGQFACN